MSRKTLMKIHLYIAAFFTPMLLIMAVSGGLYLAGFEGEMKKGEPVLIPGAALIQEGDAKADELRAILEQAGLDSNFAYIRERGAMMQTRPTSRDFYEVKTLPAGLEITPVSPDLVAALMELLEQGPDEAKDNAARALCNISHDEKHVDAVVGAGGVAA